MTNRFNDFGIPNLTDEELANKLKAHANYYWEYWDLEKLELVKEDTAELLHEAAKRLSSHSEA